MKTIFNRSQHLVVTGLLLVAGVSQAAALTADYLRIKQTEIEVKDKDGVKTVDVEINTVGDIPTDGRSGAFGYAVLNNGTNNLLVVVTHLPIDDSSYENPESGFHTHVLDLKRPTMACKGATYEVDLKSSAKNRGFDVNYKYKVGGDEINISDIPAGDLGDAGIEAIVSFTLKPVLDAYQKPSNLCVYVVDQR